MKTVYFTLIIVLFAVTGCKKDKLTGDAKPLIGSWTWVKTTGEYTNLTPDNIGDSKTIEFIEKGKYKIIVDGKKKESGRITFENISSTTTQKRIKVTFLRNDLFSKKQEFIGNCVIWYSGTDTINIAENTDWTHQDSHLYVRQN
jgi:hypothetical protein